MSKSKTVRALNANQAINAHRLQDEFGGVWHMGLTPDGYQDHYMIMPDQTVWRPRKPSQYFSVASGKLMMVCTHPDAEVDTGSKPLRTA